MTTSTTESGTAAPELEGTWLGIVTLKDGTPPFPSLISYARGGALMITDTCPGPAAGNVYHGTWTKTGPHEFTLIFLGFQYDSRGALSNYIRGHETLQLETSGNAYNGVGTVEILDTNQKVTRTTGDTTHATRVNAQ